ncbi:GNAT family N-acetyltransferase [Streptomyces yaizuensis]|uniref:N-acetyltransferase n=1 Tax=Streptomyces yaizuensis TaxID=2989713 RepID=A0ABQ5P6S6_9ACTN|nr:GNAT family N-acetyltransferase [Streptomyces sp. YSPA8]GLF98183.1 N-acetyltransferase [Streptomyces sp. YSPA8]
MIISRATLADIPRLIQFRTDAAAWLAAQGSDQWSTAYPVELLRDSIEANTVYLIREPGTDDPRATVTLDGLADPLLWHETESAEPALYVHKLTLATPGGGSGLGAQILDWCGDRAARTGRTWLRLDAWSSNPALHAYYQQLGFAHVRTVDDPGAYGSGWVAQRPAVQCATQFVLDL